MNQKSEKTAMESQGSQELLYQLPNGEKIIIETHEIKKNSLIIKHNELAGEEYAKQTRFAYCTVFTHML